MPIGGKQVWRRAAVVINARLKKVNTKTLEKWNPFTVAPSWDPIREQGACRCALADADTRGAIGVAQAS
jgi:hypothetical protein